ncbi:MAG: hypothetical protein K2M16_03340, partial [Muribaculaceae bacterium]|nr:hypothetical protein [Muribaculaceae bacterium]
TVLSHVEAAEYSRDKVFPDWDPEVIAAQAKYQSNEETAGNIYLVDGKIYVGELPEGNGIKVRKANGRGGFGPEVEVTTTGINEINGTATATRRYDLNGTAVDDSHKGITIEVKILDNGKQSTEKKIK